MTTINRNFVVKNGLEVGTSANVATTLGVVGATTIANTIAVTGNTTLSNTLTVTGLTTLNNGVILGDASADNIAINGVVNTNIIPVSTGTKDLGNTSTRWSDVWANNITLTTNVAAAGITTSTATVSGLTSLNGGVVLGDAATDNISIGGVVNTSIIPSTTASKDLGNTSTRWSTVWANNLTVSTNVAASGITANVINATDMILTGNLSVSGTTTYINSTDLNIGDNTIVLNADLGAAGTPTEDSGFIVNRGSAANVAFLWNETSDKWTLSNTSVTGTVEASISVNTAAFTVGTNFTANTTGAYHTGTINAASYTIGTALIANTTGAIINVNSTSTALRVTQAGGGNAFVVEDAASDSSPFIIDAVGKIIIGANSQYTMMPATPYTQWNNSDNQYSSIGLASWQAGTATQAKLIFARADSGTVGDFSNAVDAQDTLGSINWNGADGTAFVEAGSISAQADATTGTGAMPGRLLFSTNRGGVFAIGTVVRLTDTVTLTPAATFQSNPVIGDIVTVAGVTDTSFNGTFTVTYAGSAFITYGQVGVDASSSGGTVTVPNATPIERMRINSAGAVGIGTSNLAGRRMGIAGTLNTATSYGIVNQPNYGLSVTTGYAYHSGPTIDPNAALTILKNYAAFQGSWGAGGTVNTQIGFSAESSLTGATSNYGFYGGIGSGTGQYNLYMGGTADNYLTGSVGIGAQVSADTKVSIAGTYPTTSGSAFVQQLNGTIPSGATSVVSGYRARIDTQAAAFTLTSLRVFDSGQGTIGAASAVANQYGYFADASLVGANNNFGFYGNIPSGTRRWNLYMAGTADNYMAGSLGIGTTTLTGYVLHAGKSITGSAFSEGIVADGPIQSDVTSRADMFFSAPSVQAASFTLANLNHFFAYQNAIGAGAAVTTQAGFNAANTLTGATNNYGFYGNIPAGTGRWNLYMAGTAANYLGGDTTIVGFANVSGTVNAASFTVGSSFIANSSMASLPLSARIGTSISTSDASLKMGIGRTANGYAYIDLIGDTTYTDHGLRIIRGNTGPNADSQLTHRGTGVLNIGAVEAGSLNLYTNSISRATISAAGIIATTAASTLVINGGATQNVSGVAYDLVTQYDVGSAPNQIPLNQNLGAMAYQDTSAVAVGALSIGKAITETVYALVGTALDPSNGTIQTKTLAAITTFTDSLVSGQSMILMLSGGSTYAVTYPTITWVSSSGNVAPTLTASSTLAFWKVGSTLYGAFVGSYA